METAVSQQDAVSGDATAIQVLSSLDTSLQSPSVLKPTETGSSMETVHPDVSETPTASGISIDEPTPTSSPEPSEVTGDDSTPALGVVSNGSASKGEDEEDMEGQASRPRLDDINASTAAATVDNKADQNVKTLPNKNKKKEDKGIEYILRALSSLSTPEEKLAALCKKYADLHEEHRVLQSSFKQQQRRMSVLAREKDQLQADHTKAVIAKSKLESLCRELQKHNKLIKEESVQRAREEEEKRREISAKFQTTIADIQMQMTDNHEKNVKLREENADLAGKLKKFIEQHELREQQLEKLIKHRELEQQLADTKLQQAAIILKEEKERNLKEKELLLLQASEGHKKNSVLEAQLMMYKDRYEEFQATINKSNDMFQKLKSEMDKMGKRIKKLEKEGAQWRAKFEASNKALLDMATEKKSADKEKEVLQVKVQKLESLCRALQAELHGKKTNKSLPLPAEAETSALSPVEDVSLLAATPDTPNSKLQASIEQTMAICSETGDLHHEACNPVSNDHDNHSLRNSLPDNAETTITADADQVGLAASSDLSALVTDSADANNAEVMKLLKDSHSSASSSETASSEGEVLAEVSSEGEILVTGAPSSELSAETVEQDLPAAFGSLAVDTEQAAA